MRTKNAVVFSGRNGLDLSELRSSVLRIPEVTIRIREAQGILDALDLPKFDLFSTIAADDEHFFRNIKLKSLCATIVQIGLYDRFLKTQKAPDFLVGNSNGDSAMLVCSGQMTFKGMVETSQTLDTLRPVEKVTPLSPALAMPLLSGLSLTEYQAFERQDGAYVPTKTGATELRQLVSSLYFDSGVSRFVNVGPSGSLSPADYLALGAGEIESCESVELDPMLDWFWRDMRRKSFALAQ